MIMELSTSNFTLLTFGTVGVFLSLVVLRLVWNAVYNLFLSPLCKFPGPKLAALTKGWEIYHTIKCALGLAIACLATLLTRNQVTGLI